MCFLIIGDVGTYVCRLVSSGVPGSHAMRGCGGFARVTPQTDTQTVKINLTESRLLTVVIARVLFELRFETNEGQYPQCCGDLIEFY
jgi:hypothetical protein